MGSASAGSGAPWQTVSKLSGPDTNRRCNHGYNTTVSREFLAPDGWVHEQFDCVMVVDNNRPRNAATFVSHGFITWDGTPPIELRKPAREELASSPDVLAWGLPKLTEASRFLEAQVARIEQLPPDALRVRLMASALMAAGISGLLWWAQTDDPRTPAEVMDDCFDELHDIFAAGESR